MCACVRGGVLLYRLFYKYITVSCPTDLKMMSLMIFCYFFHSFFFLDLIVGVKRVTWPPEHEYIARAASITRQSPALQPQVSKSNMLLLRAYKYICIRVYFWLKERFFNSQYYYAPFAFVRASHAIHKLLLTLLGMHSQPKQKRIESETNHVYCYFCGLFCFLLLF